MTDPVAEALAAFCEHRTPDSYLYLRLQLIESSAYNPYSAEIGGADQLIMKGRWREAYQYILSLLPNWLLNPGTHFRLAFLHSKLGDVEKKQHEGRIAVWLLEGILTTGDGTHKRPYVVTRVEDEYDLLEHLDLQRVSQRKIEEKTRILDVIESENGRELWFDISAPYEFLKKTFGPCQ